MIQPAIGRSLGYDVKLESINPVLYSDVSLSIVQISLCSTTICLHTPHTTTSEVITSPEIEFATYASSTLGIHLSVCFPEDTLLKHILSDQPLDGLFRVVRVKHQGQEFETQDLQVP